MTQPPATDPAPEPTPLFSDPAQQTAFNAAVKNAIKEYAEENKTPPSKTNKPSGPLDFLFGG